MNKTILKMASVAAFGALMIVTLPSAASAHEWRSNQRIEQRCDRDGDVCAVFRCDWDGDDCVQISPWRRQYTRYDRRSYSYGYNDYGQYNGYADRDDYYSGERREEWRERRRDRDDDDDRDDDWRDRDRD
jgi:hypothetical protein